MIFILHKFLTSERMSVSYNIITKSYLS